MQLVDTNVFIDHLRGYAPATAFFELSKENNIIFSAVTETEIIVGKQCSENKKKEEILQFLSKWQKIDVNNPIAVRAGDLAREYGLELADAIIAASALINNAELLTRNVGDFKSIPNLIIKKPYQ